MNKKTSINFLVSATLVLLSLTTTNLFSQTVGTGIFFQAVARDNFANPAKDRNIYVQSNVIQATPTGVVVLSELHKVATDATGIFSISIGEGTRIGGTASNLSTIEWSKGPHFLNLKIAITPIAPSTTWDYTKELIDLGVTPFGTVPYALFAGSVAGFDNKLNTVDTAKMLASYAKVANLNSLVTNKVNIADSTTVYVTPTQLNAKTFDQAPINIAIGTKLNIADSLIKYVTPAQLAAKTFDSSAIYNQLGLKANITDVTSSLGLKANSTDISTSLATKVDKVTGKELSTNDYSTAEKAKLAAITGTNTGDQDLSSFATITAVALKENSANKSTAANLGGTSPSDILFPSQKAVKAYVDLLNTAAGVADGSITSAKLADGAVTDIKIAAGISASKVGLGNVNNTSDALKPISAATQVALDDKEAVANKSTSITLDASASSDTKYPSQLAVKTYVDNKFTNQTVGFSNMQTIGANTVLGNATGTTGAITEIATSGTGNIVRGITPTITTPVINGTITGSTIIPVANGGTGANSLTGFIKGNGIGAFTTVASIPVADVAGAVKTVNGSTPAADGNVAIAFGSVTTGALAARPVSAGTNGNIYVVSGDVTTAENGRTFISNGTTWNEVTANQASTDARYVKLAGSTMAGNLDFPTSTKITITDAPTSSTDVANKLYVDSKVANATPDALTSATGKIQLAGDLSGTANAPTIAAGAV
ncbi:MAG: Invertebrate iridovirus 25, partial [Bacteroidota bacterium]